jgi:hypothetical protein
MVHLTAWVKGKSLVNVALPLRNHRSLKETRKTRSMEQPITQIVNRGVYFQRRSILFVVKASKN